MPSSAQKRRPLSSSPSGARLWEVETSTLEVNTEAQHWRWEDSGVLFSGRLLLCGGAILGLCSSDLGRKVDIRLHGKGNSNSHGARPVY